MSTELRLILAFSLTILLATLVSGCAYYSPMPGISKLPGVSKIPGVSEMLEEEPTSESANGEQVTKVVITVVVQNEAGVALEGLDVVVASGSKNARGATGPSGRVQLQVPNSPGTPLDFDFKSDTLSWTDSVSLLPPGVTEATVYFRVNNLGKVLFTRLEY